MKLFLYLLRWQSSSIILYPCIAFLPFGNLWNVVISNIIGGLLYFPIDKLIFKLKNKKNKLDYDTLLQAKASLSLSGFTLTDDEENLVLKRMNSELSEAEFLAQAIKIAKNS